MLGQQSVSCQHGFYILCFMFEFTLLLGRLIDNNDIINFKFFDQNRMMITAIELMASIVAVTSFLAILTKIISIIIVIDNLFWCFFFSVYFSIKS